MCKLSILVAAAALAHAEVHSLTLRQVVELAAKQNPDLALARLDAEKARLGVTVAQSPFWPRVVVGSGLAYSYGYPTSIDGSAPSLLLAHAQASIFNRQQSLQVAQAKEDARGAVLAIDAKRGEVTYRAAALYLDAERAARLSALARQQETIQQSVVGTIHAQVEEGRALPLAEKQAALATARLRQAAELLEGDQAAAETTLALALGFGSDDRVRALAEERPAPVLPESEEQAIGAAVESSQEVQRIKSQIASKQLEVHGALAARLPKVDLIAQYSLLAKFNNYAAFFNHFQRNNAEIGMSFQVPVFTPGVGAAAAQAETEMAHLRIELAAARSRISSGLQAAFRQVKTAQTALEVARLDLDVAREQLSVGLAQAREGRLGLRQVEEARLAESDKWIAFYDAQYGLEKARWSVLRLTGSLESSLAALPAAR